MTSVPIIHDEKEFSQNSSVLNYPSEVSQPAESQITSLEHDMKPDTTGGKLGILQRYLSSTSHASRTLDPGPPPDGGREAWIMVAMAHLVVMNTWGYILCYGVFQTYYVQALNHPPSDISWVGSVQIFLLFFIGTFSGRATDAGLFRPVFIAGVIIQLLGMFMTSLCTKYWQLFLAQGVCAGIGNGLQFCPTMSLLSTYFQKRRSLVIGIAAAGSVPGGIIFPVLVQQLLPRIGFGWTVRTLAFISLASASLTITFLKTRLPPRKAGPIIDWKAFKDPTYTLACAGMFFNFWALYFAFFYVGAFGRAKIGISYQSSINLLLVMNGLGTIARIIPNYFADRKFGAVNSIIPFTFGCSLMFFVWPAVHSYGTLIVWSIFYGICSAGVQSLWPAMLSSLTVDLQKAGVRMGMGFSIVSFAALTGTPLAGALIQYANGSYLYAQMWAGAVFALGGCLLLAARLVRTGFVFRYKV